jgi:hypothetical protein
MIPLGNGKRYHCFCLQMLQSKTHLRWIRLHCHLSGLGIVYYVLPPVLTSALTLALSHSLHLQQVGQGT